MLPDENPVPVPTWAPSWSPTTQLSPPACSRTPHICHAGFSPQPGGHMLVPEISQRLFEVTPQARSSSLGST